MILDYFGSSFWRQPLDDHGGGGDNGLKMLTQRLLEVPLVAKQWTEQPERELARKKHISKFPGKINIAAKT
jgi:hypothetical protein